MEYKIERYYYGQQGFGAGVFGWSRSRHFGPAPASILASKFVQIVWYITSIDIFSWVKNKQVSKYTSVTVLIILDYSMF